MAYLNPVVSCSEGFCRQPKAVANSSILLGLPMMNCVMMLNNHRYHHPHFLIAIVIDDLGAENGFSLLFLFLVLFSDFDYSDLIK